MDKESSYEFIVQPSRSFFSIDWQSIFHYRDLLFMLVWRDFASRYKQTILGPLWFIIQPLLTTVVFTVIFGRVANISTDSIPPFLFYLCGLVMWDYLARSLTSVSTALIDNAQMFSKVYFPRLILPLSIVISNLIALAIQFSLFLCFYLYYKFFTPAGALINLSPIIAVLPFLILLTAACALGAGLWMAASTAKYRDLRFAMPFLIQIWMYATPVIYPISVIPERWRFVIALNPMTAMIETFRDGFFGVSALNMQHLLLSIGITAAILFSGIIVFNKIEKTFVDVI